MRSLRDKSARVTDYRTYRLTAGDILREGAKGVGLAALISYSFYRSMTLFLLSAPVLFIAVPLMRRPELKKRRSRELSMQFREALWIMSGYMSAGVSPENALMSTLPELGREYGEDSMIYREFERIGRGIGVNIGIERLFLDLGVRSGDSDIRHFALVFGLVKRSGGSMAEAVRKTTDVIRDKAAVSEEISTMTASQRYEQNIMSVIPFAIIVYIRVTSGDFLDCMYESPAGRVVMSVALLLLGVSYILSQKILDIDLKA